MNASLRDRDALTPHERALWVDYAQAVRAHLLGGAS
jgi:hypothetical protein